MRITNTELLTCVVLVNGRMVSCLISELIIASIRLTARVAIQRCHSECEVVEWLKRVSIMIELV